MARSFLDSDGFASVLPAVPGSRILSEYSSSELRSLAFSVYGALTAISRLDMTSFLLGDSNAERFCFETSANLHLLLTQINDFLDSRKEK